MVDGIKEVFIGLYVIVGIYCDILLVISFFFECGVLRFIDWKVVL